MNNIDAFNVAVAEIFGQCYREFPVRVSISKKDVGVAIKESFGADPDGIFNLGEIEYQIAEEATKWLVQAGYLWCDEQRRLSFKGVTLTPKGLELLNLVPDNLKTKTSIGSELSKGIKVLGSDAASQIVGIGLSYGARYVLGT